MQKSVTADIKEYKKVSFGEIKINYIYPDGQYDNFRLSLDKKGYTLNFTFHEVWELGKETVDMPVLIGSVFVDNNDEMVNNFFENFYVGKNFQDVKATKKTVIKNGNESVSYILNLGFSKPKDSLDLQALKSRILKK